MNEFLTELKKLGIETAYLIAGIAGAFVSMHKTERTISFMELIRHVFSGGITAVYLTPVVSNVIGLNDSGTFFSAFVTGYIGYKAVDLAVIYFKDRFKKK